MKVISALFTSASGSVGGMTASHNRGGMYMRAKRIPTNPNTTQQQAVREATGSLANRWSNTLTEDQRTAWSAYAFNVPVTNRMGATIKLSGINMYIRCNVPRIQAGLAIVNDAPINYTLGTTPVITSLNAASPGTVDLASNVGSAAVVTDHGLLYISRPQSPGIQFFAGPYQFAVSIAATTGGLINATGVTSPFPFEATQAVFVQLRCSYTDGRLSGFSRGRAIAIEP